MLLVFIIISASAATQEGLTAERKVDIRFFDRSYTAGKEEIERKVSKAALIERGYSKTVTFTKTDEGSRHLILQYRKIVPCHDITKVEEELRRSISGIWGRDVSDQVRKEALMQKGENQQCTAGIEIHVPQNACQLKKKVTRRRIEPRCESSTCFFCFTVSSVNQ